LDPCTLSTVRQPDSNCAAATSEKPVVLQGQLLCPAVVDECVGSNEQKTHKIIFSILQLHPRFIIGMTFSNTPSPLLLSSHPMLPENIIIKILQEAQTEFTWQLIHRPKLYMNIPAIREYSACHSKWITSQSEGQPQAQRFFACYNLPPVKQKGYH